MVDSYSAESGGLSNRSGFNVDLLEERERRRQRERAHATAGGARREQVDLPRVGEHRREALVNVACAVGWRTVRGVGG